MILTDCGIPRLFKITKAKKIIDFLAFVYLWFVIKKILRNFAA